MKSATTHSQTLRWDIFCNVIDNYGDIGVTWRLARQLVHEQQQSVRLWVDDLTALATLCPATDTRLKEQTLAGVDIRQWLSQDSAADVADVVIEAFGCSLPEAYVNAMAARPDEVLWLNLEYLSAEDWVEGCHGLPSRLGNNLQKYFFFPGFTEKTGGLLREVDLIHQREQFQGDPGQPATYLASRGVHAEPGAMMISLFTYENPQLGSWLDELSRSPAPVCLLVPQGRVLPDLQRWLDVDTLRAGDHHRCGSLDIYILPFSTQEEYDRLLWCCDLNVVRGEDSFIRAQWAGQPFLWHIYPQDEGIHLVKLQAFLDRYSRGLSEQARNALQDWWLAWNNQQPLAAGWKELVKNWPELQKNAQIWCKLQSQQKNISQAIVIFAQERLSCTPKNLA